jgi:hypothetical protein
VRPKIKKGYWAMGKKEERELMRVLGSEGT